MKENSPRLCKIIFWQGVSKSCWIPKVFFFLFSWNPFQIGQVKLSLFLSIGQPCMITLTSWLQFLNSHLLGRKCPGNIYCKQRGRNKRNARKKAPSAVAGWKAPTTRSWEGDYRRQSRVPDQDCAFSEQRRKLFPKKNLKEWLWWALY